MPKDASLDDYVEVDGTSPDGEGSAVDRDEEGHAGGEVGTAELDDDRTADPSLRPTFDWSPDGAACAACGAVVERRWRGDPGLVCSDCKDW